jgi:hypothetical protein
VASEAVPCVFLAGPASQRHITADATEEIKLDGYRAVAVKADGRLNLFSRRRKSFDHHYPLIVEALGDLPEDTVRHTSIQPTGTGIIRPSELKL